MTAQKLLIGFILVILVIVGIYLVTRSPAPLAQNPTTPTVPVESKPTSVVTYACNTDKTITASYFAGTSTAVSGRVDLVFSDSASMSLNQVVSADGVRYANTDASFVFWNKGNGALVLEHDKELNYVGCVEIKASTGTVTEAYHNGTDGFTLRYPKGYSVSESYKYQALGPAKDISGTKFTIPTSTAFGTNLSKDSYLSIEHLKEGQVCSATAFLSGSPEAKSVTDSNTTYSFASSSDAGAGNRYDEIVYAITDSNPCMAIRYFLHSSELENYPKDSVKAFDLTVLLEQFDAIRHTLVFVE